MVKSTLKERAINLRRRGFSYSEILKLIPVAKSTLSLWLRNVGLSKSQIQKLSNKKLAAAHRGGEARRSKRLAITREILKRAAREIGSVSQRELWLMGIMLYWAEGSKEKDQRPGLGVQFTNSDPQMIKIFLKWLTEICKVQQHEICFDIFIHENSKNNIDQVIHHWSKSVDFPKSHFPHVYFKKSKIKTLRKNIGSSYYGLVKVRVKASSSLNRKIAGWVNGVVKYFR